MSRVRRPGSEDPIGASGKLWFLCRFFASPTIKLPLLSRALRDQVLSIGTRISPNLVLQMRLGPVTLHLESLYWDWNQEWTLVSPANETGTGPY